MEYLIMIAALAVFMAIIFIREARAAKKRRKLFVASLYQGYGKLPDRKYSPEAFLHIPKFYARHPQEGQIDDITWNDLDMDEVFRRMNYTFSATGEEYLYYMLRTVGGTCAELAHLEEVVAFFGLHEDERVSVQLLMSEVGHTGKYSLYDYIDNLDDLGERSNQRHHLANFMFLPLILLAPFHLALSLCGIAGLCVYQIISYFKGKNVVEPYIASFSYVIRLMDACKKICCMDLPACSGETERMRQHLLRLKGVRGGSYWVFSARQSKTSGSPLDIIMDYLRMIFHVDLIIFNKMLRELREHVEDVDGLIREAGYLEAAISIGAFRASLKNGWCVPEFIGENTEKRADSIRFGENNPNGHTDAIEFSGENTEKRADSIVETKKQQTKHCATESVGEESQLIMTEGYHPLLEKPVKNTIRADRGVLLTGSNASGKSTFLKTVALNAVLAQTIHTCAADSYQAYMFRIYSSMALRDDLNSGESYYIVEIKSLKRILDKAGSGRVLCFVDEVLRGTNTVERIAASTEILQSLTGRGILCFAATHDIELTDLLSEVYDNYHFEEEIVDGDISFPYKLLRGKASTRNAIRLLELMGYDGRIVEQAFLRAKKFVETGVWQA